MKVFRVIILAVMGVLLLMIIVSCPYDYLRANDRMRLLRSNAAIILLQLQGLDSAKEKYVHQNNMNSSENIALSNLITTLTSTGSYELHLLVNQNGADFLGNPILIGTNNITIGGRVSDSIKVSPKTKALLRDFTKGDEFWGKYR